VLLEMSTWVIPVLLGITLHEAAHAFVAWLLGDDTAYRLGRVSANPLRHVDPVGTVLIPGVLLLAQSAFLFGYAKPVPVRFDRLRSPRRDSLLVAIAGPGANLALAFASALLLPLASLLPTAGEAWVSQCLWNSLRLNLILAVFNMLPLPPLDGGRVLTALLPLSLARPFARLERFGIPLLLACIFLLPLASRELGLGLDPFGWLVVEPARFLGRWILGMTGGL